MSLVMNHMAVNMAKNVSHSVVLFMYRHSLAASSIQSTMSCKHITSVPTRTTLHVHENAINNSVAKWWAAISQKSCENTSVCSTEHRRGSSKIEACQLFTLAP